MRAMFLLLAAMTGQPAEQFQPSFEFRGLTTQTSEQQAVQAGTVESCHKLFGNIRDCVLSGRVIGGVSAVLASASFRDGYMISIDVRILQENFDQLKAALEQRYGPPCLTDPSPSRALEVGRSYYWCFSDGAARVEQFSFRGMSRFEFYARSADDIIGDLQPKVDF